MVQLIECPRDAMQGWADFIPTETKIKYINSLLKVGFDTIDFGSFVSAKWIPQMADTREVLHRLDLSNTSTKLLAIVANLRGAQDAVLFDNIDYLGYPLSVSETFQRQNTNSSIAESMNLVEVLQDLCIAHSKKLVIYLSMAFGNPYGDAYTQDYVLEQAAKIAGMGIGIISLADTVGVASPGQVREMSSYLINHLPQTQIGVHLHSKAGNRREKLTAAIEAGCKRFDGALKGVGGCPMAGDTLVGNMPTEWMIDHFSSLQKSPSLNHEALAESLRQAGEIFHI